MRRMKKLLFITTRLFWPIDSGRKVSLYYYCKGIHEVYGYEIYLYSFLESEQTEKLVQEKPDFIRDIKLAKPISKSTKIANLLVKSAICGWPFQNAIYYNKANLTAIKEYLREIDPDTIMVDMIRLAPYYKAIRSFACKKILDMDDLLSVRYFRQAHCKETKGQIFGAYSTEMTSGEKKIAKSGFIKKLILRSEGRRVRRAEKYYGKKYDNVIFVSDKETQLFNNMIHERKAITVRLGVDYEQYAQYVYPKKEDGAIGFLGNLKVAANVDSLDMIIRQILPKLQFDYKFYVVGVVPDDIKEAYAENPKITFCGRVDDPRDVLGKCEVFLSPIAYGTGIKTKILEAMAMGLPVVTNSIGVEGIDGINGKHFLVEDNPEMICKCVDRLLVDRKLMTSIGVHGRELVKEFYSWDKIYSSFSQLLAGNGSLSDI